MLENLPKIKMPDWLSADDFKFNLKDLLIDSLYYPSCGTDGIPVQYFMGNIYSFIYADYGVDETEFLNEVYSEKGFKGYRIIHKEKIEEERLFDMSEIYWTKNESTFLKYRLYADYIKEPYNYWMIFEREGSYTDDYNPRRFSLLFMCREGVASFSDLYYQNKIVPKILCIIQDGSGFGCNWTSYTNRNAPMAQLVFSNDHLPEYLINGGYNIGYEEPIWDEYTQKIYYKCFPYLHKKGKEIRDARSFCLWGKNYRR